MQKSANPQNRIDLMWQLVKTSFKMRYQNSVLGFLWVLIKPYTTFIVMFVIWSKLLSTDIPNYAEYLLIGIVYYTFVKELVVLGQMALLERADIILKVNFPRQIAVLSALTGSVINLVINMLLIFIIVLVRDVSLDISGLIYLTFIILTSFIWGLGLALITSIWTIRLRDLKEVFDLGLFLLYWATPIMYTVDQFSGRTKEVLEMNPLGFVMNQVRASVNIYGEREYLIMILICMVGIIFTLLSWMYFSRGVKKIAEYF